MIRGLFRLAVLAGLAVLGWRFLLGRREPQERAGVSYDDGSSLVLEPGSSGFERLATVARSAIQA